VNRIDPDAARDALSSWLAITVDKATDVAVTGVEITGDGFSHETVLFDATWRDANGWHSERLVARVEPTEPGMHLRYDIRAEHRVLRTLRERTAIPVPRVRFFEEDASVLGAPFIVMDRVAGRIPLDDPPYRERMGARIVGTRPGRTGHELASSDGRRSPVGARSLSPGPAAWLGRTDPLLRAVLCVVCRQRREPDYRQPVGPGKPGPRAAYEMQPRDVCRANVVRIAEAVIDLRSLRAARRSDAQARLICAVLSPRRRCFMWCEKRWSHHISW
jgi:Phosphotransferase enzyme family